jgi:ubiquinone/menaquinone biosynthesis C-methylase UbiE
VTALSEGEFRPTWDPENLFVGTACYYSRYRPQYPDEAISLLRRKFKLDKSSRVLDLGCGPGHLTLKLASRVARVIAVDPQAEMLAEGRRLARQQGLDNIDWTLGSSGDLPRLRDRIGAINITVMGRSFHWMDRRRTLRDLYKMTKPGGGVAILADSHFTVADSHFAFHEETPWRHIVRETTRKWLGEERKAGTNGIYAHPKKHHPEIVANSEFTGTEVVHLEYQRTWTVDEIIGYLYSTSHTSVPVLGEKKEPFEADLRRRLLECEPSGTFTEKVVVQIIMAWKPAA